jgi:predicted ATP-grasp superfamily ATP-dependent carboligase
LLSIYKDELSRVYKVTVPSWDIVRIFYYKLNCYEYASRLGIPVPKTYKHNNLEELLSQPLDYPLVLKPNSKEKYFTITKKKAVRVDNPDALKLEYSKMAALVKPENVVVQEMIIGGPKHLYSFATVFDGENILAGLSARRVRQHPMDFGRATTYAEAVEIPELEDLTLRLLRGIKYTGIAEVEFMFDEKTGLYKFLEINGRPWGWHTLTKAAGVNMPHALFRYVQGERIERVRPKYDVKWLRLITDLPVILKEIASGRLSLREYSKSWDRNTEFAVFSRKDPVPFFMEFLMLPYLYYKRGY